MWSCETQFHPSVSETQFSQQDGRGPAAPALPALADLPGLHLGLRHRQEGRAQRRRGRRESDNLDPKKNKIF